MYKNNITLLLSFSLMWFINSCDSEKNENTEMNSLKSSIDEFYKATNSGDTDKRLSMFTPDALILPNYGELFELDDSARANIKRYDDNWIFRIKDLKHVEIEMKDDIAYTVNTYFYTFHPKDSMPEWHKTKNVHIWKKQDDGYWKLHLDIWNSSVPSY